MVTSGYSMTAVLSGNNWDWLGSQRVVLRHSNLFILYVVWGQGIIPQECPWAPCGQVGGTNYVATGAKCKSCFVGVL